MKQSPSFGGMKQSPFSGGVTTQDTTTVEIRDNAYGTIPVFWWDETIPVFWWDETIPVFWWDWPDEALLADFAEKNDWAEQAEPPLEDSPEYATLYFVS